ncbi:MAG: hypothetical protein ACE15F_11895 [bacterium]
MKSIQKLTRKALFLASFAVVFASVGVMMSGAVCEPIVWDLTAGQTIIVGNVSVTNDADNIYVTYTLDYTFECPDEFGILQLFDATFGMLQMWIGYDISQVPANKQGIPVPGQFPYQYNATGLTDFTFTIPFSDLGIIDVQEKCDLELYIVTHAEVDMDCDLEEGHETAWGGDQTGGGPRWWFYGIYTVCCYYDTGDCWEGETAWAAGSRYVEKGNWAMYVPYEGNEKTVDLIAGQYYDVGDVTFSVPSGGLVIITITLNDKGQFQNVDENVKIQDYASAPSGNPNPGGFMHKGDATGTSFSIDVPVNNFYGVHVDVERKVECPPPVN